MRKFTLFCAAAAIIAPAAVHAQETTGAVRGTITSAGSAVADAEVVITHVPSGTVSRVQTDQDGDFSASGLRVGGPYTIQITAPGYEPATAQDISLTAGEPLRLPVELNAAGQEQEIVVTGTRGVRETSQGPISSFGREEIEGVASINRDIRDIARRDPFVNLDLAPGSGRAIEVAGQNGRFNRFSVDGVQFSDDFGLNPGGLPTSRGPVPFDAIEQLAVKVAPYDIAEGDFQGGAVNVVLRSGGNRFRGSIFGTYSDDSLTGDRTRGQNIDLEFESKQYGGFISGPIFKDRLFFMLAYEKTDESDPFDEGVGPGFANQVPLITLAQINAVSDVAQTRYNYDTLGLIQNAVEEDEKFVAKLDWNINDDHRASLSYVRNIGTQQFQQNTFTTPTFAIGLQSNGYELMEEVNSGVFQLNSTWSSKLSSEIRASYRDYNRDQTPFGGREISQFEVCLDPVNPPAPNNSVTACNTARVFFGPDVSRQSNDLNTENKSVDATLRYAAGDHALRLTVGWTDISVYNLFLQRSLGDLYFDTFGDFQNGRASRFRLGGAVPSLDPIDAAARFNTHNITIGVQDDWDVSDTLQLTFGLRYDVFENPDRPPLNQNFLSRYGFANTETFSGRDIWQPRFGFNWQPQDRLIIRGGVGVFAGGTPDVYVSNSFSNTGQLTNAIDITRNTSAAGCNIQTRNAANPTAPTVAEATVICNQALNNVTGQNYGQELLNYLATNTGSLALAPTNAIDPDLDVASQLKASLSVSYEADFGPLGDGWLLGADVLYGNVIDSYVITDIRSVATGTLPDGRPRYNALNGVATTNQDLLMTNDSRGRSIVAVARIAKEWDNGLGFDLSYTRADVKDVSSLTSSTAGSNYGNNAFADPNFPAYGRSIYEIRDTFKFGLDYKKKFFGDNETRFSLFGERRTGRPYSLTMNDADGGRSRVFGTVGNLNRQLLYVPTANDPRVVFDSPASEAAFNTLVTNLGIEKYRGRIVPKNSQNSPSFFKVDLHVSQELPGFFGDSKFELFADVENFLNLLDSDWGSLRQVSFPYTAAVVNVACLQTPGGAPTTNANQPCAQYRYSSVISPNETLSSRQSLYQFRVGARFKF